MRRCYNCKGETLEATSVDLERKVAGRIFKAPVPAVRCPQCGEETYAGPDLESFDLAVAGELARHGELSPEAFRFMRKALGLPAKELAELLDVAHETVSRWEHGRLPLERRAAALLAAMVLDKLEGRTSTLERLTALLKPEPLPALVRLAWRSG